MLTTWVTSVFRTFHEFVCCYYSSSFGRRSSPYIKGISAAWRLSPYNGRITHKPTSSWYVSKARSYPAPMQVTYQIPLLTCGRAYTWKRSCLLGARLKKCTVSARRHNPNSCHCMSTGHIFNWQGTRSTTIILFMQLDPCYSALRLQHQLTWFAILQVPLFCLTDQLADLLLLLTGNVLQQPLV